jgi:hypothetical protein
VLIRVGDIKAKYPLVIGLFIGVAELTSSEAKFNEMQHQLYNYMPDAVRLIHVAARKSDEGCLRVS